MWGCWDVRHPVLTFSTTSCPHIITSILGTISSFHEEIKHMILLLIIIIISLISIISISILIIIIIFTIITTMLICLVITALNNFLVLVLKLSLWKASLKSLAWSSIGPKISGGLLGFCAMHYTYARGHYNDNFTSISGPFITFLPTSRLNVNQNMKRFGNFYFKS